MEMKTTHEIIDEQFDTKVEKHTLRTIRLAQPREDLIIYHQKKWIALDDLNNYLINYECHHPGECNCWDGIDCLIKYIKSLSTSQSEGTELPFISRK